MIAQPLSKNFKKLLEGADRYNNNAAVTAIQSFMDCFNVTDDKVVVKLIKDFQENPKILLSALKFILKKKGENAKNFFEDKKNFFHFFIYTTLSSYYREKQCEPGLYFDILKQMKEFFETKNLSEEFRTILNQLISYDYIKGQDLTWKEGLKIKNYKMRDLCITVNSKKGSYYDDFDNRFKIISNIFNSKRVKNEAENVADGAEREMVESIEVLPFFQNNKLLFNGNKKISLTNQNFNGKSRVQIYFEYFGEYLSTTSIEYLLGTIGLKKGAKAANDAQRLAFLNRKKLIDEKEKVVQPKDKSANSKLQSAIKDINELNKEISAINYVEKGDPINPDNIYTFDSSNLYLENQSKKIEIKSANKNIIHPYGGNIVLSSGECNITTFHYSDPVFVPNHVPLPPSVPTFAIPMFKDANISNVELKNTMVSIDSETENNLFYNIINCKNFSKLDPKSGALKFNYNNGNINSHAENCKILSNKNNFSPYQIQDLLFGNSEFLKEKLSQELMIKVTNMEKFENFRNFNGFTEQEKNPNPKGAAIYFIKKRDSERNIMRNLYLVQKEFLSNPNLPDFDKDEESCIIENCKRFYFSGEFNGDATDDNKEIIYDINHFLFKNLNQELVNHNNFNKKLIANSLFGFQETENGERTTLSKIKIKDLDFAKEIIHCYDSLLTGNNLDLDYSEENKYRSNFQKLVDETTKPISPTVLSELIKNKLISKEKLAKELVKIIHGHDTGKKYNNFIFEDFLKTACSYLGLEDAEFDLSHDKQMISKRLIKKYNIDVTEITLDKVLDKNVLENTVIAKELCSVITLVDSISSNISELNETKKLFDSALETYRYVDRYGFLKPEETNKSLNEKKQNDINNIDQLKDLVKKLKECLLSQIDGINRKVTSLANEQLDNKDLITMKDIVTTELSGIKTHVLSPHLNNIVPAPEKNNLIKLEFKALLDVSKQMVKDYNKFIKIYKNKNISELKKEQESITKLTKSRLINNLEEMVTRQQREWKKFFSDFTNQNKGENDLEQFFDKNYNNINDYYNEIIKNINQYSGNNEKNLNRQASKYIDKLKKKMEKFDEELKNACNFRNNCKQETALVTKKETNVKNSKILTSKESEEQKNSIEAEEKKINDSFKNKKTDIYKNVSPDNSLILYDNTQKFLSTSAVAVACLGIPAVILTGASLFFLALPIGGTVLLAGAVGARKKINDRYTTYTNASLEQQIYENTFEKNNQQSMYDQEIDDNISVSTNDSESEEQNDEQKKIKNETNTNLEDNKTQIKI